MRKTLLLSLLITLIACQSASAIIWKYSNLLPDRGICRLAGWSGTQPSSGKLTLPSEYTDEKGVTYSVVSVEAHALDNLTEVTEIIIPASIIRIGEYDDFSRSSDRIMNFQNCPRLKRFTVKKGNPIFAATSDGILTNVKFWDALRVPPSIEVSRGTLTLADRLQWISADAMTGVSTVSRLELRGLNRFIGTGGINEAPNLREVVINEPSELGLQLADGVIIFWGNQVVAAPGALQRDIVRLPSTVKTITSGAFQGVKGVKNVVMPEVESIGPRAFAGSGLTTVNLPASIKYLDNEIFMDCPELTEINFECDDVRVPERFAKNAQKLKRVKSSHTLTSLSESAFMNCRSLEEFPFSGSTDMSADSIFYACGFNRVVFNSDPYTSFSSGVHIFTGCNNLEVIDASAVDTSNGDYFTIGENYAVCRNLKRLKLPRRACFWTWHGKPTAPAFGYSCAIDRIELHELYIQKGIPMFCYSVLDGVSRLTPEVYAAVTSAKESFADNDPECILGSLFSAANGATVAPRIFIDSFMPRDGFEDGKATYYVPGLASDYYFSAVALGAEVHEMFGIELNRDYGNLHVSIDPSRHPAEIAAATDFRVIFEDGSSIELPEGGTAISATNAGSMECVRVEYTVNGVRFATDYESAYWISTGADKTHLSPHHPYSTGRHISTGDADAHFQAISLSGAVVAEGKGKIAELPALPAGLYIIRICYPDGDIATLRTII